MRVIGYPPLSSSSGENVGMSCGEHCDYGCLTLLLQDETRDALQVKRTNGEWINANPVAGALVLNIGDMIQAWTRGLYKSTLHRVIHNSSGYRVSVPFFFEPNFDAEIRPIPGLPGVSEDETIESIVYGEHLLGKVSSNFDVSN